MKNTAEAIRQQTEFDNQLSITEDLNDIIVNEPIILNHEKEKK